MSEDELKRRILGRRARFIAAALASAGIGAAPACGTPQVCLFPVDIEDSGADADADADATPQPCLTPIEPDAAPDAASDGSGDADAGPQPCLVPIEDAGDDG